MLTLQRSIRFLIHIMRFCFCSSSVSKLSPTDMTCFKSELTLRNRKAQDSVCNHCEKDSQSVSSPLSLSLPDADVLFHVFVSSQIDYCYALSAGLLVPARTINRLQLVQKAASHILSGTRWSKHITSSSFIALTAPHIQQQNPHASCISSQRTESWFEMSC